ncbi:MspA (plasmid) [Tsukamurella tyrosinosolvens]|nr:MspA [Tsukamurella tyrosinosolvens]
MTKETRIAMDSCLGGAQIRAYATATLSTDQGDSAITTYGKPLFIERDNPGPAKNRRRSPRTEAGTVPAVAGTTIAAARKAEPVEPATKPAAPAKPGRAEAGRRVPVEARTRRRRRPPHRREARPVKAVGSSDWCRSGDRAPSSRERAHG